MARLQGLLAALIFISPAVAGNLNVPGQFPTISAAIQAAQQGDMILVQPGVYFETIDFSGKDIVILGVGGPEATVLDGQGLGTVVRFENGESPAARIEGFTIQNGFGAPSMGGGIQCTLSSPTIANCVVRNNRGGIESSVLGGGGGAGGIKGDRAQPTIDGCLIELNIGGTSDIGDAGPGGVLILRGAFGSKFEPTTIRGCNIRNNTGGGVRRYDQKLCSRMT